MKIEELIQALNGLKVETGSLACMGCGHEHNCSTHGCAILREAIDTLSGFEWIDPKVELPPEDVVVLVKHISGACPASSGESGIASGSVSSSVSVRTPQCWPKPGCSRRLAMTPESGVSSRGNFLGDMQNLQLFRPICNIPFWPFLRG